MKFKKTRMWWTADKSAPIQNGLLTAVAVPGT